MARTDITDRIVAEAAHRAEAAVRERAEQLKRKLDDAQARIDLSGQIRRHPWPAIGIALAAGAFVGLGAGRSAGTRGGRKLGGAAMTALGTLVLHLVREVAVAQLGRSAKRWWLDHRGDDFDDPDAVRDTDAPFPKY